MSRGAVAGLVLAAGLVGTGAAVRLAQPGEPGALAAAARDVVPRRGAPGLIVVVDPECPACASALEELRAVVRPEELGVAVRVLPGRGEGRALLEAAGPGLVPVFVVVDAAGHPVAVLRGPRPPALLRSWLEEALARSQASPLDRGAARSQANPLDRGAARGPP
jgi:hypothetical protein